MKAEQRQPNRLDESSGSLSNSGHSMSQAKPDYSTFIEQLQQTTERLMNQVFALPSLSEIKIRPDLAEESVANAQTVQKQPTKSKPQTTRAKQPLKYVAPAPKTPKMHTSESARISFALRSRQQEAARKQRIAQLVERQQQEVSRICTYRPKINQTEISIRPIQQRAADICRQKERKLQQQRAQQKIKSEKIESSFSFTPQVNHKTNPRTSQQYYEDKVRWEEKRLDHIEKQRQLLDLRQNKQAIFEPEIVTGGSPAHRHNALKAKGTRVEDRLLRSLQRSAEKLRRVRTELFF